MGSTNDPENGEAVGSTCYAAAVIYAAMIAFCSCQVRDRRFLSLGIWLMGVCRLDCTSERREEEILLFEWVGRDWELGLGYPGVGTIVDGPWNQCGH